MPAQTLTIMSLILGFLFAGITFLTTGWGFCLNTEKLFFHRWLKGILGNSFLGHLGYYIFQFSTALILAVAANTGFSAFPMLAYNMAKNKYMPHLFMEKGDRLGYSNGILTLAFGAMILLLIFNGNTERLIPLYTIGVFVPFALSQTGMILHWKKEKGANFLKPASCQYPWAIICYAIVLILLFSVSVISGLSSRLFSYSPYSSWRFTVITKKWPNNYDYMKASKNVPTMEI